jgi:hypothetical protein
MTSCPTSCELWAERQFKNKLKFLIELKMIYWTENDAKYTNRLIFSSFIDLQYFFWAYSPFNPQERACENVVLRLYDVETLVRCGLCVDEIQNSVKTYRIAHAWMQISFCKKKRSTSYFDNMITTIFWILFRLTSE